MPAPVRLALPLIRRGIRKSLWSQGTTRHSAAEITAMGMADLAAFPHASPLRNHLLGTGNLMAYRARIRARWFADLTGSP